MPHELAWSSRRTVLTLSCRHLRSVTFASQIFTKRRCDSTRPDSRMLVTLVTGRQPRSARELVGTMGATAPAPAPVMRSVLAVLVLGPIVVLLGDCESTYFFVGKGSRVSRLWKRVILPRWSPHGEQHWGSARAPSYSILGRMTSG